MQRHTCTVALLVLASLAGCVLSNDAAADNNIGWRQPVTTTSMVSSSTPAPTSSVWVSAHAAAGEQWTMPSTATVPGTVVTALPISPGRWQRRRRHQQQYPLQTAIAAPAGAAAIVDSSKPAGTSPMGPTTVSLPAGPPGTSTTAYIPGSGWATVTWGTSAPQQQGAQGWPDPTGTGGPQQPQPGMVGMGPPGRQRGVGGMGPLGMNQPPPGGGPILPGGSMPGSSSGSGSISDTNSLAPDAPMGGMGSGAWAGGRSSGSSGSGGGWGRGMPAAGGSWGAWGGRRNGPLAPPSSSSSSTGSSSSSDDDDGSEDTPVWPWPGSPLSTTPSPKPSSPAFGVKSSPSPSLRPGSSPISSSTWSGSGRPSPSPSPSSRWTPPSTPTAVTGPSKTDPDRPWLFPGRGASPSPSLRPGMLSPPPAAAGSMGRAPSPSPRQGGSWAEGDADEWDEGVGDDGSDNAGSMMTPSQPPQSSPSAGTGGSMPTGGGKPGSPSPSPRPGSSVLGASGTGAFVTGVPPVGGGMGPRASPSPRPSAAVTGGLVVVDVDDDEYEPAMPGPMDIDIEVDEGEGDEEDSDVPDVTASSSSSRPPSPSSTAATGSSLGPRPLPTTTATRQQQSPGPAMGGGMGGKPGSGAGSVPPKDGSGSLLGPEGLVAGMGPAGSVSTEAGPRASSAGNASSTTSGLGGFVLGPTTPRPTGTGALGAGAAGSPGARVVVPMGASPAVSTMQGPKSVLIEAKGATKTVLMGCVLPFEGSDQTPVGKAVHAALLMALRDLGPSLKIPVNINLTCLNTRCLDIPAHNAMEQLVKAGAVAVVGDICSAASVAAAGVAGTKQVPLISPASSSPQLTGMSFFYRTVPSDRYQGAAAAALVLKKGIKRVGMVYEDVSYGYGLAFNFIASFTRDGGAVSPVEVFKKFQGDPAAAVAKMVEARASKADPIQAVVISTSNITYFTEFLRAAAAAKLDLPILGGDAIASPTTTDLLRDSPGLLKNVHITAFAQGSPAFQKKFAEVNPGLEYDGNAAQGYDAMHALLRAYMDAPAPKEPQDIASQITKQKFKGVSGPIAFDSKGDLIPHDGVYITITFDPKTGQMVFGDSINLPDF